MPSRALNFWISGIVASPTPMMPMASDSTRITDFPAPSNAWANAAAAIHPAVPPPTTMIAIDGLRRLRQRDLPCGAMGAFRVDIQTT